MAQSDVLSPKMLAELKRLAIESHPRVHRGEFFIMGIGELRQAFNDICQPAFTCTLALLDYERGDNNTESQILLFRGTAADGTPFEIKSAPLSGDIDLNGAAKTVAQKLLDQRKPTQ